MELLAWLSQFRKVYDMWDILLYSLTIGGIFTELLGILTVVYWVSPLRYPADKSNRINRIRLWWFVLTRPELFVQDFPWLKKDELANIAKKDD